ncbi:unnamed protein product [Debaryomyces tyrocola]|nr:unnamed protein product [Debaryomyces tyrocola]
MSAYRPRRNIPSAVNTPTAVRVEASLAIDKSEAETILSDFISVSEAIAGSLPSSLDSSKITFSNTGLSSSTGSSAILSQLKRVQRDLRGLPPLLSEVVASTPGTIAPAETINKKIKFDDEDADASVEPKSKKIKFDDSEVDASADAEMAEPVTTDDNEEQKHDDEEEDEEEEEKLQKEPKKSKKEKHDKKEKKEKKHKKEKKEKKDKKKESKD